MGHDSFAGAARKPFRFIGVLFATTQRHAQLTNWTFFLMSQRVLTAVVTDTLSRVVVT